MTDKISLDFKLQLGANVSLKNDKKTKSSTQNHAEQIHHEDANAISSNISRNQTSENFKHKSILKFC